MILKLKLFGKMVRILWMIQNFLLLRDALELF